jgi:bifunctional non-homologous end joining protein LigD
VVLDGEVVVVTPDGRADFELLGGRIHGRRRADDAHPISFYVFDVLQLDGHDIRDRPWTARRQILDDLDLAGSSAGAARSTIWTADGAAMHEATRSIGAEGTVSKRSHSAYRPGRSRHWLKTKHKIVGTLPVVGWRPSTPARAGGLILADKGEPVGRAALAMPEDERRALVDLLQSYGRHHPTGTVTIPEDRIQAVVQYTSRTPTHGHLREAFVVSIEPAHSPENSQSQRQPRSIS